MTTGVACPPIILQFTYNNGQLAAGGSVLTQVGGVNAATYQDIGLTTPLPNPIPLNSRGEISNASGASCQLFLTPNTVYTFTVSDASGNQIWVATYVNGVQVSITQASIGTILYPTISAESAVTVVNPYYNYGVIDRYGTNTTPGSTNMLTAINAAIAVMFNLGGGVAQALASTYFHSAGITFSPGVTLQGMGKNATIFLSTHTGNGITNTMTFNQSNDADTEIRNCTFKNTNSGNTGGGLVDTTGTFVRGRNVRVNGFAYSRIFNQTELGDDDLMDYEGFLIGGVWLTNGGDFTSGASPGFTNRISVKRSQFNSAIAGAICVIDDGGAAHAFEDNNYNLCAHHFRVAGCKNISIVRGEYEVAVGANILFRSTTSVLGTSVGATDIANIEGTWMSPVAGTAITFTAPPTGSGGTLTAVWGGFTGQYQITFSDSEIRTGSFTTGSTAVTWSVALTGTPTASGNTANPTIADIAAGSLISINVVKNRFLTAFATILGVPNLNTLFAYGNEDSNAGMIFDGLAGDMHFEFTVARGTIITKGNISSASPLGINGAAPPGVNAGWGTPTAATTVSNFPGTGATLSQVGGVVSEIIAALKAFGLFGS